MHDEARRRFVLGTGASLLLLGCGKNAGEEDVSPPEDLMREHGVLNRILLVYEESGRRLSRGEPLPIDAVANGASIIQRFIEGYHEKLEEDFLFPRFEKANLLADLVRTLRRQHQAGRKLTEEILRLAKPEAVQHEAERQTLVDALGKFARMYRPHEAREDTVLFPALRRVVSPKDFDALGELFEDEEHERFGKAGFEGIVEQVGALEKQLGTHELDAFTPE